LILAGFGVVVVYFSSLVMVFENWKFYSHTPAFYNLKKHCSMKTKIILWHSEDHASWYIVTIKANKMHYFSTLFW
jgi:hypothetical protein